MLLLVSTASFCGNTPQYTDLEKMYEQYQREGFEILAFPANNFGQQEPGTNAEIKTFCYTKYSSVVSPLQQDQREGRINIRSTAI